MTVGIAAKGEFGKMLNYPFIFPVFFVNESGQGNWYDCCCYVAFSTGHILGKKNHFKKKALQKVVVVDLAVN